MNQNAESFGLTHKELVRENLESVDKNIYNVGPFDLEKAKNYIEKISGDFSDYFTGLGYLKYPPVKITSGIDPTVRFVGSHISVLKPFLNKINIPQPGVVMVQDCLRTRNSERLLDDTFLPNWGSYFVSIGGITSYDRLNDVCEEVFRFFENKLGISKEFIKIRVNSSDTDLIDSIPKRYSAEQIEIDSKPLKYYRHKIGMDDVSGRNFNIALKDTKNDDFADVGNIIVLEDSKQKLAVEIALGTSTILKQMYGLSHVSDCNPVLGLEHVDEKYRRKFEDSIIVSTLLFREGLKPSALGNKERIFRTYLRSLSYFRIKNIISLDTLGSIISDYEIKQFGDSSSSASIVDYLKKYESEITTKEPDKLITEEDKIIFNLLTKI